MLLWHTRLIPGDHVCYVGVSQLLKLPLLDTLQQFHIVKPLLGQTNTPTSFLFFQCFTLFLIHDRVCSGTQESQAMILFFFLTRLKRVLHLERFTERSFQQAFPPLSFAVGEDSSSAMVHWCGCRPTQLNKHTYCMWCWLTSHARMTHVHFRIFKRNVGENRCVYHSCGENDHQARAADTADRHDSGSRQTWPPHWQSKQIRGQSGHGLIRHDCARLISRCILCLGCLCVFNSQPTADGLR